MDYGASAYYRVRFVNQLLEQSLGNLASTNTTILPERNQLFRLDSLRLQRVTNQRNIPWAERVLVPARKEFPFRLIYDIDDVLIPEDMPDYNIYRDITPEIQSTIKYFMDMCDLITVSCAGLADYYSGKLGIERKKFKIMENYPPQFFFDHFNPLTVRSRLLNRNHRKLRICFSCSQSHFGQGNDPRNNDFSGILDWIIENRKKYQFIFHGGMLDALKPYSGDFEYAPPSMFLQYPLFRQTLFPDLYIQPLQKNLFNECKSPIKLYEAWAEGVPAFVQDIGNYHAAAPEACFRSAEQLERMIAEWFSASPQEQYTRIMQNYMRLRPLWLESNTMKWAEVLLLPEHYAEYFDAE